MLVESCNCGAEAVELLAGLRGVRIFGRRKVSHDALEPQLRVLLKALGKGGKGLSVIPRNALPGHAGVNLQM